MQYRKIQYGPVPDAYFRAIDELFESGKINIDKTEDGHFFISETHTSKRDTLDNLDKEEVKLIGEIANKWKDKRTQEIVEFTHKQLPYMVAQENGIIPYEVITQEDPGYVY